MRRPTVTIAGAGRLARALAAGLDQAGYPIAAVWSRRRVSVRRWAGQALQTTDPRRACAGAQLLLLAVSDAAIAEVAALLADARADWDGRVALHHAGAYGPEPLAPLGAAGAATGVLHPLVCVGGSGLRVARAAGARARIEGRPEAVALARRLCRDLGLRPLRPTRNWTAARRVRYHAGAALAANDLVALIGAAVEQLRRSGVSENEAREALLALATTTLDQARGGLDAALTGPVVRGDAETVEAHLRVLGRDAPLHRALSARLHAMARRAGRGGTPRQRRELRRLLHTAGPDDPGGV